MKKLFCIAIIAFAIILGGCINQSPEVKPQQASTEVNPQPVSTEVNTYPGSEFLNSNHCKEVVSEASFNSVFSKSGWTFELDDAGNNKLFSEQGMCRFRPPEWKEAGCDVIASEEACNLRGGDYNATKILECSKDHQARYKAQGCDNLSYFSVSVLSFKDSAKFESLLRATRATIGNASRMLAPSGVEGNLVESNAVGSYYFDYNVSESISARFITSDKKFFVILIFMPEVGYDSSFNRASIAGLASIINNNLVALANKAYSN